MRLSYYRAPLAVILLLVSFSAFSQKQSPQDPLGPQTKEQQQGVPTTPGVGAGLLTAADVAAFLDGLVPPQIERNNIAGAVVAVVKDGKVLFAKGYGYADAQKRKPVSDSETLFRPGSISKLFTWTAVMQMVEQGKLDLDRDVNEYLDFKIPATYAQPITLRHIMTHTPGFEETVKDLFVTDPKLIMPLDRYLRTHIPRRIFPPGTVPAYSNYATSLAGYIVQRLSGEKFEDYISNHIFKPLDMTHATFVQPLPEDLKPLMSEGYDKGSDDKSKPFEIVVPTPAGALSIAGQDIARFMIAHLQDGEYQGQRILKRETAQLMHSRQFGLSPDLNGMCLGFYEETRNGHRMIGHGGDTQWFHSDLHLMADQNLGFYISGNSAGKGDVSLRNIVWRKFLDRYFPYAPPAATAPASKMTDAKTVSRSYLTSRRFQTTFLRLASVTSQLAFTSRPDGSMQNDSAKSFNGEPKRFDEIAPLLYRERDGQDKVAFVKDSAGRLMVAVDFPAVAYQTPPWYQNQDFVLTVLIGCIAVCALTIVFWIIVALVRWHYGRRLELTGPERRLRFAVRIVCVLVLVAVGVWAAVISKILESLPTSAMDPWIRLAQVFTLIALIATLVGIYNMVRTLFVSGDSSPRWWFAKLWDVLLGLACIGFIWVVFFGHLLQITLNY